MNKYLIIITLMFMAVASVLTACNPGDESITETTVTPIPDPGNPGNDDNSGNGNNNNGSDNNGNDNNGSDNNGSDNNGNDNGNDNNGNNNGNNNNGNNNNENNGGENEMSRSITIRAGGHSFSATLEESATTRAFAALLPMTVTMNEMNGNEKYHYLSENLPTDSYRPGTIRSGDLMLYGSDCVVLFYETFSSSYSYTRIGRLDNPSGLASALGRGNVSVTFEINKTDN